MKATVVGIYGAYYEVRPDDHPDQVVLAKTRGKLRLIDKSGSYFEPDERHLLTIGDSIEIHYEKSEKSEANIIKVYPRQNSFQRATARHKQTLAANLSGIIVINSLDMPPFNRGLLSRLLVESILCGIHPFLILNKMDMYDKNKKPEFEAVIKIMEYYKTLGMSVFFETFHKAISELLKNEIARGRYLAFGESGVGKSTFINQMLGKKIQAVDTEEIFLKGRHVTTNPVLYLLGGDIELIDVPGIREFGLMHRSATEIARGFPEFNKYICRYSNCFHVNEPECGVKEALGRGDFPAFRYEDYVSILDSMKEKWKPRRGDYRNE